MSDYSEFFLNSKASVVQLECFELKHSSFSQTYRIVRNATLGITVTHEDSSSADYVYYPCKISRQTIRDDLDQILNIQFGDLGEIIPNELANIKTANTFNEYPSLIYRAYRSDTLDAPLYGPITLEIRKFDLTRKGAVFQAAAPSLNTSKTGERYAIARFPMLQGLL